MSVRFWSGIDVYGTMSVVDNYASNVCSDTIQGYLLWIQGNTRLWLLSLVPVKLVKWLVNGYCNHRFVFHDLTQAMGGRLVTGAIKFNYLSYLVFSLGSTRQAESHNYS